MPEIEKKQAKIILIDDDRDIVEVTKILLESRGYTVISAYDGKTGLETIRKEIPDLVLLDVTLPDMNGFQICEILKKDNTLWHIPIIYFTARERLTERVLGLSIGGDDYITKPFDPEELLARIKMIMTRTYNVLDANPLTKLPGNHSILKNISQSINSNKPFAVCFLDIDNFKSFNDENGFEKGDEAIVATARIIIQSVMQMGNPADFVGHIGGDDFVFISTPDKVESLAKDVIKQFDEYAPSMYSKEVRKKGYVVLKDRQGELRKFPIMSISLVIVSNEKRDLAHMGEITSISSELKKYAKSFKGSIWVKDRRTDGPREDMVNRPVEEFDATTEELDLVKDKEEKEDTKNLEIYNQFEELFTKKKINIFFLPVCVMPGKKPFGYNAVVKGLTKTEVIQPDVLFDLLSRTDRNTDFMNLCFDKINVFTYGLQEVPKIFLSLSLTLFMSINIKDYLKDIPIKSLVLTFSEKEIYQSDELFRKRLNDLRQEGLCFALADIDGVNLDLKFLSDLKPDFLILSDELTTGIEKDSKKREIIQVLTNIAMLFSSRIVVTGIDNAEDIPLLSGLGITLFQGPALA